MHKNILILTKESSMKMKISSKFSKQNYKLYFEETLQDDLSFYSFIDIFIVDIESNPKQIDIAIKLSSIFKVLCIGFLDNLTTKKAFSFGLIDFLDSSNINRLKIYVDTLIKRDDLSYEKIENTQELISFAKKNILNHNLDIAVELLKKSIVYDLNNPEPYNLLGFIYQQKDNTSLAKRYFQAALVLDPTYHLANLNLKNLFLL